MTTCSTASFITSDSTRTRRKPPPRTVYTTRLEGNEHLAKAGHVLKLFTDEYIAPQTPFQDVQATALYPRAPEAGDDC